VRPRERMQGLRLFAAGLLCVLGLVVPGRARAQAAAPIDLKWSALEGCPSADTVLARVRKIAGATRPTAHTLRAEASVTQPSDGTFRLRLEIHYGNLAAVRNIEGKSCKDLAGAAAVALALLLSSEEPLSERDLAGNAATTTGGNNSGVAAVSGANAGNKQPANQAGSQSQSPSSSPSAQPTTSSVSTSVEAGAPRRWHVLLLLPLGSLGVGPMKQVSLGLGGSAGLAFDRWRFLAEGRLWASQHETTSHLGYDYDVELNRFTFGARACRVVFGDRFEFAPCALMSVHHLSVRGSGRNLVPGTDTATWASVGIGARSRFLITPWLGLVAAVDGELQLSRPEVSVSLPPSGSQQPIPESTPVVVERLAPAAATITVGVEWIL